MRADRQHGRFHGARETLPKLQVLSRFFTFNGLSKEGRRFQGFITPLKGGVKPSFETFLPLETLEPNKGFTAPMKPSETFAIRGAL
jgi:hypothetical protein